MSENTNVNAVEPTVAAPDQGELQGVPSAAERQEVAKAKRRQRLSAKANDKVKADSKPAPDKGKGKGKGSVVMVTVVPETKTKPSKSNGLKLVVKAGRITNIPDLFRATNNGKSYAVSRFIVRLLNSVLGHKWDRKVGEGMGDGLEYHWLLKTAEEGTVALQHATDAAKVLGFKLGTGNGDGDGFLTVEPDGKPNSKVNRLVFAY